MKAVLIKLLVKFNTFMMIYQGSLTSSLKKMVPRRVRKTRFPNKESPPGKTGGASLEPKAFQTKDFIICYFL